MAFDILSILNGATLAETERTEEYQDIVLDYRDIVVTNHNKYSMVEIQELATGILMTGGLQAPLVVGRVSGEYWLLSGHRRYSALRQLIQEGHREYEKIPCRYKDMDKLQFRMELLCGNTFNRKLSDYDLMMQAQEWKEILTEMKTSGALVLNKGERIRDYVAQILGESSGKIGQLNAIYKSAPEEVKEKFQSGEMGITSAYEASRTVEPQEEPQPDEKSLEIQKKAEEKRVSESDTKGQRDELYHEPDMEAVETPEKSVEYDRDTLLWMIRDAEETMEQMKEYWISNDPEIYTKNAMKIQAYKLLLEQHDRGIISCPHRS
jgi:parB-like nuclease domain|nr:MAG TPA: chromosome partitioning protein [Caudoviricetes sp.]